MIDGDVAEHRGTQHGGTPAAIARRERSRSGRVAAAPGTTIHWLPARFCQHTKRSLWASQWAALPPSRKRPRSSFAVAQVSMARSQCLQVRLKSNALEVKISDRLLTIGELARRAGVATSALRYYEELGLLPRPARIAGQRRYPESAAWLVGVILLLRDVGFRWPSRRPSWHHARARPATGSGSPGASLQSSMTRSPRPGPPATPSITRSAARTTTSSNAPTSPPSPPPLPAPPASRTTKPTRTSVPAERGLSTAKLAHAGTSAAEHCRKGSDHGIDG